MENDFFVSKGLQIDDIGLILDETTSHTLEAFVRFATSDDFDMALKRNWEIMGNRHVKIFRSSEIQMNVRLNSERQRLIDAKEKKVHTHVDNKPKHLLNQSAVISLPIERVLEKRCQKGMNDSGYLFLYIILTNLIFDLDEWQRVGSRRTKSVSKKGSAGFYMVLARGWPWKVTKSDVIKFFKGIKILNGEKGINIIKNIAMEAYVELSSKADVKKALALNNKSVDLRPVHGNYIQFYHFILKEKSDTFLLHFTLEQLLRLILRNMELSHLVYRKRMTVMWCKSEVSHGMLINHTS